MPITPILLTEYLTVHLRVPEEIFPKSLLWIPRTYEPLLDDLYIEDHYILSIQKVDTSLPKVQRMLGINSAQSVGVALATLVFRRPSRIILGIHILNSTGYSLRGWFRPVSIIFRELLKLY